MLQIIQVMTTAIYEQTGSTAIFHPTTKGKYPPTPIKNICDNFPKTQTEVQKFFGVRQFDERRAEVYLAFSMRDTSHKELHDSLKHILREYSLWLTSAELKANTSVWVGWIKSTNPTYTNPQRQATKIQEAMIKVAEANPTALKTLQSIKEKQFIQCKPGLTLGNIQVKGEAIHIFTTDNNYGPVLHLLGKLPENCISPYYRIIPKTVKRDMNKELYDRLIQLNTDEVNNQQFFDVTHVDSDLFDSQINFHPDNPQSVPFTVKTFLHGPGRVLEIEPTIDTEEHGTYRMLTTNSNHDTTLKKLNELVTCLMKVKETNQSMTTSAEKFGGYIEVLGNQVTNNQTNDLVRQLEVQVNNQTSRSQPQQQNQPNTQINLWDIPSNISLPSASLTTETTRTYKSAVQNVNPSQSTRHNGQRQPQQRQQQNQQQQQQQSQEDKDRMDTGSNKSDISEISATPTMKTMKSVMTSVSLLNETMEDLKGMMNVSKEERKEAERERIRRENTAKQERIRRDKKDRKERADERKKDKQERLEEANAREAREQEREANRERIRLEEKQETRRIRKKEKEKNDKEKKDTKDGFDKITAMMGMFGDFVKDTHKDKLEKEEKDKEEKEKREQKEKEKEEKEKIEKAEKEKADKVVEEATRSWMVAITNDRNIVMDSLGLNQLAPQKTITGETSVATLSTLTTTSSPKRTPRPYVRYPRQQQNQDGITTIVTAEKIKKKRKSNERIEDKEISGKYIMTDTTITDTTTTIGTDDQTEQSSYDNKNGEDSKQNHDVQTESIDPQRQ